MRTLVMVGIALGNLVWAGATVGAATPDPVPPAPAAQSSVAAAAATKDSSQSADDAGTPPLASGKSATIEDYIKAAKNNGYEPSILGQPGDRLVVLKLTKFGLTEDGYGILQKKWQQKDTIDLTFGKTTDGVSLDSVSRDVMVKPPIGDWIKQPSKDVPAWVLAPAMTKG